jgi:hypothetical protein
VVDVEEPTGVLVLVLEPASDVVVEATVVLVLLPSVVVVVFVVLVVDVVGTEPSCSKAPLSHLGPAGRLKPRWSVSSTQLPAPIATLPVPSAMVSVGPPLSASGPSARKVVLTLLREVVLLKRGLPSTLRLPPSSSNEPIATRTVSPVAGPAKTSLARRTVEPESGPAVRVP